MAKSKAPHIALSYSRLSTYEGCPEKFKSQYLDKDYPDEGENYHFTKGKRLHSQCENYIKSKNDPTIINMLYDGVVLNVVPIIDALFSSGHEVHSELQLATDVDFQSCGWFDKVTAWRAIVDCLAIKGNHANVIDFKSGKVRDYDGSKTGQLHLTAAIIFATYPEIDTIKTAYLFLEHRQSIQRKFTRDMYNEGLLDPFNKAFKTVNSDKDFSATRMQYCNWCLRNKKNEGTCSLGL